MLCTFIFIWQIFYLTCYGEIINDVSSIMARDVNKHSTLSLTPGQWTIPDHTALHRSTVSIISKDNYEMIVKKEISCKKFDLSTNPDFKN